MRRRTKVPAVTANQARYILEKLIDDGTVSAADVRRHLAGMWREMSFLEKRLSELRGLVRSVRPVSRVKALMRVRRKPSPRATASRKLQGQYIAYIRQIPEGDRKRFTDIAKTKGRQVAIAALKRRLGK